MIQLFTHYVPRGLIVLAALEALVLLIAAYVGISCILPDQGWRSLVPQKLYHHMHLRSRWA